MKKLYIIIGIAVTLGVYTYFGKQYQKKLDAQFPSVLENNENKSKGRSFWGNVINIMTTLRRPKTDGKPLIQPHANSDRSACSKQPTIDQKIITQFAGYVLEYPCAAGGSGNIHTYFDSEGKEYQSYTLYLHVLIGGDKNTIWRTGPDEDRIDKESFRVRLTSNGKKILVPSGHNLNPIKKQNLILELEAADLALYRDEVRVVGLLTSEKDASGHSPAISCLLHKSIDIEKVFNPIYSLKEQYPRNCRLSWMITEDIQLRIHSFEMKYAYHFKEVYQKISAEIIKIIIEKH